MNSLHRDILHFGDRLAQAVASRRPAVYQFVIQEAMARVFIRESENVVYRPGGSGARREVEFYVVFVLV